MVMFGALIMLIFLILLMPQDKVAAFVKSGAFIAGVVLFFANLGAVLWRHFYREMRPSRVMAGSLIMHASMAILLTGAILSAKFRETDAGVLLTEGQSGAGGALLPNLNIGLDEMKVVRGPCGNVLDLAARFTVRSVGGADRPAECRVNHPAKVGGAWVYIKRYGISPQIQIDDAAGNVVFKSFVNFDLILNESDFLDVPALGIRIKARKTSKDDSVFRLLVEDDAGAHVLPDMASPGIPVGIGRSMTVSVPEVRRWAQFSVVRDPGFGYAAAGCVGVLAGMLMRLFPAAKRRQAAETC
ncbi:MAG: hypothetical protein A3G34_08465 [Candidatus Lindowbacteria bacterium RIFCSPLOWO2_12_FULL_62_27]|nr:MAG: hypothetical protein A3G34_08465 [Candidatus Lindowbacteria bacterium RIFCSPLOWO2_12_FULL_62_27]OGH62932.1 MAG: hypothetical protein A3I06_13710 [Candidatus Lindowbacteria bacterium RIFCSPLOWO2_02_FULL_62_12]